MAGYQLKTQARDASVAQFLSSVANSVRRADAEQLSVLMERATGEQATMWGPSIVGFGRYHYRYASGHEGDMCRVGFAPRASNLALYVGGFTEYEALLARLGKHKRAKACLYVNKLADIDLAVLEEIVRETYRASEDGCPVC